MKKRAIGAVISMIMVFSMLAGCGGASGGTEGNAAGQSVAEEAAEDQSASECRRTDAGVPQEPPDLLCRSGEDPGRNGVRFDGPDYSRSYGSLRR